MSRTKVNIRGVEYPKGRKTERGVLPKNAPKNKTKKWFGFTNGAHSRFEDLPDEMKDGKNYPVKGEDFIKYGYGNGTKKENRIKGYKKEKDV